MLRFASEPACQANYCRSNLLRPFALENSNGFEQILAHRIGCQRAKPPCLAERHSYSQKSISEGRKIVNTRLSISTGTLEWALGVYGMVVCAGRQHIAVDTHQGEIP